MTYRDDILRLREAEIEALRKRVDELEAQLEVLTQNNYNEIYK